MKSGLVPKKLKNPALEKKFQVCCIVEIPSNILKRFNAKLVQCRCQLYRVLKWEPMMIGKHFRWGLSVVCIVKGNPVPEATIWEEWMLEKIKFICPFNLAHVSPSYATLTWMRSGDNPKSNWKEIWIKSLSTE